MKKINLLILIFTFLLAVSAVCAQETEQTDVQNQDQPARPFRLLQELDLTREQIQQIRRINQERRPVMQEAQRRWRMANRDLDLAIYADDSTEERVKELLKAAQVAHAELLKERTLTEYLIRKVLTPEQLVKFRNLRETLMRRNQRKNRNIQNDSDEQQPQRPVNRFQQKRNQRRGQ